MFDRIAGVYDLMNTAMTAGLHHRWRERAADRAELEPGDVALDVCCGTGDLALELARARRPLRAGWSAPTSPSAMLDLAREQGTPSAGVEQVRFEWADALELPYDDASFDAVTVGFGVRNLADLERGLAEMSAGAEARRPAGDPRDHPAAAPAALDLLLALVRPARAAARHARRRPRRLHLPARVGEALPAARGARRDHGPRRARADPLHDARRRDHRDPLRRCGTRDDRSAVPPPVTQVLDAAAVVAAAADGRGRAPARASSSPSTASGSSAEAGATLAAGGKRLRPMLVLLCAGPRPARAPIRAATAIELVHMATLVHDDVLDAAPLRRGLPTVVARAGRGDGDRGRRPAVLARVRRARRYPSRAIRSARSSLLASASVALARGELAQRRDAFDLSIDAERYLERCRLKTARLFECACLIGADPDRRRVRTGGAGDVRPRDRARLPAPRRRARRRRPAGAHRQGARHRPARRHRDPAADPRARARPGARRRSTCGRSTRRRRDAICDRIAATGALDEVRDDARERVARGEARALERPNRCASAASCCRWSPTASSSATPDVRRSEAKPSRAAVEAS